MSLVQRLRKQARWHEDRIWSGGSYSQNNEDMRALLIEAVNRLVQLEYAVEQHAVFKQKGEAFKHA